MSQLTPSDRITHLADLYHRAEMSNGSSVPSNWVLASTGSNKGITWSPQSGGGGATISYGSNAMDVNPTDGGGASTDVSRMDHRHRGVRLISSAGSNSLVGDINFIGGGSVGVTVSGQTIQFSGPGNTGAGGSSSSALFDGVYGPGSDGDVTIAAGTTSLSRDMYYNNLTVTGTLDTNGWRVFVKGTISGAGTVSNNCPTAGNGGNGTGAAGGAAGNAGANTSANNLGRGSQGIAGRVGGFNAVGLNGTAGQTSSMFRPDGSGLNHPIGAAGGAGTNAGGTGAAASTGTNALDPKPLYFPTCVTWRDPISGAALSTNDISGRPSGSGSGGGGSGAGGGGSGGTGAGGGPIVLCAKTWSGTFVVQSKGGNGGNGGNGFAGGAGAAGGGGGGNGGPGGTIIAIFASRSGWSGSIDASGGAGGTKGSGGNGGAAGADGSSGPAGQVIQFQMG